MNTKLDVETIDMLSKAVTQFAFRSGPVEEMHSRGKNKPHPSLYNSLKLINNELPLLMRRGVG